MTPERELNESGEKGTVIGIILSKRKGGIKESFVLFVFPIWESDNLNKP